MRSLPEVQEELEKIGDLFSRLQSPYADAAEARERAKTAKEIAIADFIRENIGQYPATQIKEIATSHHSELVEAAGKAEGEYQKYKVFFQSLDRQLEAVRSQNSTLNTEMQLTKTSYHT